MKRKLKLLLLLLTVVLFAALIILLPRFTKHHLPIAIKPTIKENNQEFLFVQQKALQLKKFCYDNNYSTTIAFILDMKMHSGKKRFYVYDFVKDTIAITGLVAHGSCNKYYLSDAKFSNTVGCGCSAFGKYKIGYAYAGRFGKAYKLYGLDKTNNNAFDRNIVLHAYDCVPDEATYPQPICNSLGCTMVSYHFLDTLSMHIKKSNKPIILWMLN
ncbi:MAG: murein L,D-transpeptidase catalytic domain-containing protein [Chitinophagaceae bacterium]